MSDLIKVADWSGAPLASVIFMHGLGGHPYYTWRRVPDNDPFWPLWLAQDNGGPCCLYAWLFHATDQLAWYGHASPGSRWQYARPTSRYAWPASGADNLHLSQPGGLVVKQLLLDLNQAKEPAQKRRTS